jgi:hypothetical protein
MKTTTLNSAATHSNGTIAVTVSARDRIKPRGLVGIMKGKIHYDENADIFNLGL